MILLTGPIRPVQHCLMPFLNTSPRKFLTSLISPAVCFYTLPWLMLLVVIGTIAQRDIGLHDAQQRFFTSWILWVGGFPLPGALTAWSVIGVSLIARLIYKTRWLQADIGSALAHLGVVIFMLGGLMTQLYSEEGIVEFQEGEHANNVTQAETDHVVFTLPFQVQLKQFTDDYYPGTQIARGYQSAVIIQDKKVEWPAVISMNHPLRYNGYTFYQQSFVTGPKGRSSVLAVVHNPAASFPYVSGAILAFGLLLHAWMRFQKRKAKS